MGTAELTALDVFWSRCEGAARYGVNDCCMALADTILAAGGPDLMTGWRGRYSTKLGYLRIAARDGFSSAEAAVLDSFSRHGEIVDAPRVLDVALVHHVDHGGRHLSPAFFHDGRWNLRGERGLVSLVAQPQEIFRVI